MAKKTTKPAADQRQETVDKVLTNIESNMLTLSKKKDVESVSSLGRLGRLHAQISAEKRKAEKEERRAMDQLTPAAVIAWLKTLPPAERGEIVRTAQLMDEKRSGLA